MRETHLHLSSLAKRCLVVSLHPHLLALYPSSSSFPLSAPPHVSFFFASLYVSLDTIATLGLFIHTDVHTEGTCTHY